MRMHEIEMSEAATGRTRANEPQDGTQHVEGPPLGRQRYEAPRVLGYGSVAERTGDQELDFGDLASS